MYDQYVFKFQTTVGYFHFVVAFLNTLSSTFASQLLALIIVVNVRWTFSLFRVTSVLNFNLASLFTSYMKMPILVKNMEPYRYIYRLNRRLRGLYIHTFIDMELNISKNRNAVAEISFSPRVPNIYYEHFWAGQLYAQNPWLTHISPHKSITDIFWQAYISHECKLPMKLYP